ncbi:MAG: class I SAM-dependent DNA methyltransferase [Bacteroidetes bacterium]|nr:class I SAM-dependent DNA methyltransferase [Bacteroidota bacterium]
MNVKAVQSFIDKWSNKDNFSEISSTQLFWLELLSLFDVEKPTEFIEFEKPVTLDNNHFGRIDAYIAETKVLIEQKKIGVELDKLSADGKWTPYQQAKEYSNALPLDQKPRWIITCNFSEFHIYDMNSARPEKSKQVVLLKNLAKEYNKLKFLVDAAMKNISHEMELSIKAGDLVGKMYDLLLPRYKNPDDPQTLQSLNQLCVRIVFCLFAEDAELFLHNTKTSFHDYLAPIPAQFLRDALIKLFNVLDTKQEERDEYLQDDLKYFPYVNGGLFSNKNIEIPQFTEEIKELILQKASAEFDWSDISPTIFGAVFESTLNPETRRSGGMHYTSIENIHKVIDPLFLDDLKNELKNCKTTKELLKFQDKISKLTFLDPACGSGNFLTETYISLRNLENDVIRQLQKLGQANLINPIKVTINQFYGIEINDFAVSVAKTALWIAELQQQRKTNEISQDFEIEYLPLKEYNNIKEANALRIDWNDVIQSDKLNYIIGNPPFVGAYLNSKEQKQEIVDLFGKIKLSNSIDYVSGWFYKASEMMYKNNEIRTALVSTNSITQGEQVYPIWHTLFERFNIKIDFAWRTFRWDSESSSKAHVHCVIIGFSSRAKENKCHLYDEQGSYKECKNINPYLIEGDDVIIESRASTLFPASKMIRGNQASDGGNFILTTKEKEDILNKDPELTVYIRPYMGAEEYIKNKKRYCFWLKGINPSIIKKHTELYKRIEAVRQMRLNSSAAPTRKKAEIPYEFFFICQPDTNYMIIPRVSSENRKYVPMGIVSPDIIASDRCTIIPNATLYNFGILISVVHMAWMRTVTGRLKSDYNYSGSIVYNNFPWIEDITEEQKAKIEKTAQAILDARALYPDSSLADLYDETSMPVELRKAHNANDREVLKLYGMKSDTEESEIVSKLFKMYQEKINEIKKK